MTSFCQKKDSNVRITFTRMNTCLFQVSSPDLDFKNSCSQKKWEGLECWLKGIPQVYPHTMQQLVNRKIHRFFKVNYDRGGQSFPWNAWLRKVGQWNKYLSLNCRLRSRHCRCLPKTELLKAFPNQNDWNQNFVLMNDAINSYLTNGST